MSRPAPGPSCRFFRLILLIGLLSSRANADEPFRDAVRLPIDTIAARKLATARERLAEGDVAGTRQALDAILADHADSLVPTALGRYRSVAMLVEELRWAIPPQTADEKTTRTAAIAEALRRADLAFAHGKLSEARSRWQTLRGVIADREQNAPNIPGGSVAELDARLIVADLASGRTERVSSAWEQFQIDHPNAVGTLGGRTERLTDLLDELITDSKAWRTTADGSGFLTYAGEFSRQFVASSAPELGSVRWTISLPPNRLPGIRPRAVREADPSLIVPAIPTDRPLVFHSDGDQLRVHHLISGQPAEELTGGATSTLAPDLPFDWPTPLEPTIGLFWQTVTLADGWAYTRLGSPMTGRAKRELRPVRSELVRVSFANPDRDPGPGWPIVAGERFGSNWTFEGTPIVIGGEVYVILATGHPNVVRHVVAFRAASGEVLWNQKIFGGFSSVSEEVASTVSSHLLTSDGDRLFYVTHRGAIVAMDRKTGRLEWAVTYPSETPDRLEAHGDYRRIGLLPGLVHAGVLYAKPNDSSSLFAIDTFTGEVLWERSVPDRIRYLLGVADGVLVISGRSVWGLDAVTGQHRWGTPRTDTDHFGFGRGLLIAGEVWFPTLRRIERLRITTGQRTEPPIELEPRGGRGGHLLVSGDWLVIAEPHRLAGYSAALFPPRNENRP